jgi:hypothetical protein
MSNCRAFQTPFPSRVDKRSCEKRLAWVNPQYQTSFHGSPLFWVIPQPGLSTLQRCALLKRGPVRDELGLWAEERPSARALSSRCGRFLPPISFAEPVDGIVDCPRFSTFPQQSTKRKKQRESYYYYCYLYIHWTSNNDHTRCDTPLVPVFGLMAGVSRKPRPDRRAFGPRRQHRRLVGANVLDPGCPCFRPVWQGSNCSRASL